MSLQVSAQRRAEPATSTRLAAGCSRSAAASSSAIGRTFESSSAARALARLAEALERGEHVLLDLRPEPLQRRGSCCASAASLRSSSDGDSELVVEPAGGFRAQPRAPGSPRSASAGNFAFSFAAAGISPVSSRASIFSASVLPTPGISVALPAGGQLGDRDRALADRLGGVAVGEHPVFDRAVELVEDSQLVQRGGDLGVGHGCKLPLATAVFSRFRSPNSIGAMPEPDAARLAGPARPTTRPRTSRPSSRPRGRSCRPRRRVLIVDDNSPDGTGEIADRLAARARRTSSVLHRPRKEGLGPAYIAGFRRALAGGAGLVAARWTPTSPTTPPTCRACWRRPSDADLVLGSRYVAGGGVSDWGPLRRAISRGGSAYARLVLGVDVRDLTGGFKCFRREVLEAIDLDSIQAARLRLPGRDDLPGDPRRLPGGRGADRLPRPPGRQLEDEPRDRRRGDLAGAAAALRRRARRC